MFETVVLTFLISALLVTLGSGAACVVLHAMFGAELPLGVQPLSSAFKSVFMGGASLFLGPLKLIGRALGMADKESDKSIDSNQPPKQLT
jgi:hypothetical protein